jgi:hypothetical protein
MDECEAKGRINNTGHNCRKCVPAYDLRDIVCNIDGMAEAFFGRSTDYAEAFEFISADDEGLMPACEWHSYRIILFLHQNKKEEAEKYLIKHCVFAKNK